MKKCLSLFMLMCLFLTSSYVFAEGDIDCILTPAEGKIPYPHEVQIDRRVIINEIPDEEKTISLEKAEKNKIWEKYGYTKEEFDNFPDSLRDAMLFTPEEIGKSFGVPTREDFARWAEKEQQEKQRAESEAKIIPTNIVTPRSSANEVRNAVGEFI